MSTKPDHYEILGVSRTASEADIKRAYKLNAKKFHPDRNPDDPSAEEKFKRVQQAYGVLGDVQKRAEYDRFGDAGVGHVGANNAGQRVYQWGGGSSVNLEDLEDLMSAFGGSGASGRASVFDDLFAGGHARVPRPSPQRGADAVQRIELTFEQAVHGVTLSVKLSSPGHNPPESLDVKIPPGVADDQKIRLRGKGHPGQRGGPSGDLLLMCKVKPHAFFVRQGSDITLEVPVTLVEAALGAKIEVPTLDGRATVALPPGTPSGMKLRLSGRGVKKPGGKRRGDQYIVINIEPPKEVTDEQRSLLERLKEHDPNDPRADRRWWPEAE